MKQPASSSIQSSGEILTSIVARAKEELAPDYFEAVRREADEAFGERLYRLRLEGIGDEVIVAQGILNKSSIFLDFNQE